MTALEIVLLIALPLAVVLVVVLTYFALIAGKRGDGTWR